MSAYENLQRSLQGAPRTWLVTGAAGFIGSHLLETLLKLGQRVIGVDNFLTGHSRNLDAVKASVGEQAWTGFRFVQGDVRDPEVCRRACADVEFVLHQAALGSVPRSLEDPLSYHDHNVTGFVSMLQAAREAGVRGFVFASSSAVYGDSPELPKVEDKLGQPLSPYAATKLMNEIYAATFARAYGFASIGLRYFNVFGPRQDPQGAYAAVIPRWIAALMERQPVYINGDGETSRDFCFIDNVVQANLLAATASSQEAINQVYNIAVGERTTLNRLFETLSSLVGRNDSSASALKPIYREFRPGDVRHSLADISKARRSLGYEPTVKVETGLERIVEWHHREGSALT